MILRERVRQTPALASIEACEGRCFDRERGNGPLWYWRVKVWSRYARTSRVYTVRGESDTVAAQEGLRLFGEELDYVDRKL